MWKKAQFQEMYCSERNNIDGHVDVIEYLVVLKREVYALRQLRQRLEGKVRCCMPKSAKNTQSGFVTSVDANILPDAISAIVTRGVTNYIQLKAISRSMSFDIQGREKVSWPPTRKNILESNEFFELDKSLFNLIAWIVSPNAAMGKDGFVELSYGKATKISEIVQNIQSLVPVAQPDFNQIILSITMLAKTGSQMVVNNLKQLGHGLSNTERGFIQDKWAEWTETLKSIIPSNIKKRIIARHVFDNIDWKLTTRTQFSFRNMI